MFIIESTPDGMPIIVDMTNGDIAEYLDDATRVTFNRVGDNLYARVERMTDSIMTGWASGKEYYLGVPPPVFIEEGSNPRVNSFNGAAYPIAHPSPDDAIPQDIALPFLPINDDEYRREHINIVPDPDVPILDISCVVIPSDKPDEYYIALWSELDDDIKEAALGQDMSAVPSLGEIVRYMRERERDALEQNSTQLVNQYDMRTYLHPDWSELAKEPLLSPETIAKIEAGPRYEKIVFEAYDLKSVLEAQEKLGHIAGCWDDEDPRKMIASIQYNGLMSLAMCLHQGQQISWHVFAGSDCVVYKNGVVELLVGKACNLPCIMK
jgi:hypothetical protein